MKIHLLPILQFDTNLYRNTLMKTDAHVKILQYIFCRLKRTPEVIVAMKLYQVRMIHIRARIHQIKRTRQGQI